jgi:hypothetical protein
MTTANCNVCGGKVSAEVFCLFCRQAIHVFCSVDDGVELEDRTRFVCLKCGEKKLPSDSNATIGTSLPSKETDTLLEEPLDGSQTFCVGEQDEDENANHDEDENTNHDDSDASDSDQDIDDVVAIAVSNNLFDVQKKDLGPYIMKWMEQSDIIVNNKEKIVRALEKGGSVQKLFEMVLPSSFWDAVLKWTNQTLALSNLGAVTKHQFMAYVGLELVMSIHPLSEIRDYWSAKPFLGVPEFRSILLRRQF